MRVEGGVASKVCSKSIYTAAKDIKPEPTQKKKKESGEENGREYCRERAAIAQAPLGAKGASR